MVEQILRRASTATVGGRRPRSDRGSSAAPTALVLVRHAHVTDNSGGPSAHLCGWCDPPLSELGRAQAQRLRDRLAGERFAAVYTSPLRRAADTAACIADRLRIVARPDPGLREIGCGDLDGMLLSEVRSRYPDLWRENLAQENDAFCWPGGESYRGFRARALAALRRIARGHPGERVLVVTHAGVITQLLGAQAGTNAARWEVFRPGNASLTEVRYDRDQITRVCFDDRAHLDED